MRASGQPHPDSPWQCICCDVSIAFEPSHESTEGRSLTDNLELHVCNGCWGKLTPFEKLQVTAAFRLNAQAQETMQDVSDVCKASMQSLGIAGLGPGTN